MLGSKASDRHALHSPLLVLGAEAFVAIATQEAHTCNSPPSGGGGERQDIWQEKSEPRPTPK